MPDPISLIPAQHTGISKEVNHHRTAGTEEAAAAIFKRAKARLMSVNSWAHTAEGISGKFLLCDREGNALNRSAQQGDLMRIDLPGPHRVSASGFDWVLLETLQEGEDDAGNPWMVLTTRPTADPTSLPPAPSEGGGAVTAHFFSDSATGTFVLRQLGLLVDITHYGRNELPNTEGNLADKARALLITVSAYLGLSDVQWSNLVKGLLD